MNIYSSSHHHHQGLSLEKSTGVNFLKAATRQFKINLAVLMADSADFQEGLPMRERRKRDEREGEMRGKERDTRRLGLDIKVVQITVKLLRVKLRTIEFLQLVNE